MAVRVGARAVPNSIEGLNVVNDPKDNKALNVIIFCPK